MPRLNFKVPTKWNDVTEWQLSRIGKYMFEHRSQATERKLMASALVVILLLPSPSVKNIFKVILLLFVLRVEDVLPYADFIFDRSKFLTRFPKYIKVGRWPMRKRLYGPSTRMANSTIEELSYADTYYYKWITTGDLNDLHRLTAILYRPAGGNDPNDVRQDFSGILLEKNAHLTDKLPFSIKFMIAKAYEGSRDVFITSNPNVFPQRKVVEGEEPKPPKPYQSLSKIIDSMAMDEIQIFGNHQATEKVYASKFLKVFEESIKREKQRERNRALNK